jgi:serine/threonine-protein phosphatase 2B catalytic subunit
VHGGLSPDVSSLEEIRALDRHVEIPREGPLCDLLWSDPYEAEAGTEDDEEKGAGGAGGGEGGSDWFGYNEVRQCSFVFGVEAVKRFLKENKLTSVIRAHEAQKDGYKMHMVNRSSGIPRVITIFSAPNYCDAFGNKAACLKFDNNVLNIKQFIHSAHPYYLPNFMDVFQWSLPFVAEKVTDMLHSIMQYEVQEEEEAANAATLQTSVVEKRGGLLKKKILAVTKLVRVYKTLREQNEALVQLKQLTPNQKIPVGLLRGGEAEIKKALSNFNAAKRADRVNERRPSLERGQGAELLASAMHAHRPAAGGSGGGGVSGAAATAAAASPAAPRPAQPQAAAGAAAAARGGKPK